MHLGARGSLPPNLASLQLAFPPLASLVALIVNNLPAMQETRVQTLGREDPLKKGIATVSSILAWRIPQRSMAGYSPWCCKELDRTEGLTLSLHFKSPQQWL